MITCKEILLTNWRSENKRFNPIQYIKNSSSNKLKQEDKLQQINPSSDFDNNSGSIPVDDSNQNSNKSDIIKLIENENSLVDNSQIASLKYDPDNGILGRIVSHQRHSKVREISNYRETKQKIKSKKLSSAEEENSQIGWKQEHIDSFKEDSNTPGKFHKFLSQKQVPNEESSSKSQKEIAWKSENEKIERDLATFNPKIYQAKEKEASDEKEIQKCLEKHHHQEIAKEQCNLPEFEEKAGDLGKFIVTKLFNCKNIFIFD